MPMHGAGADIPYKVSRDSSRSIQEIYLLYNCLGHLKRPVQCAMIIKIMLYILDYSYAIPWRERIIQKPSRRPQRRYVLVVKLNVAATYRSNEQSSNTINVWAIWGSRRNICTADRSKVAERHRRIYTRLRLVCARLKLVCARLKLVCAHLRLVPSINTMKATANDSRLNQESIYHIITSTMVWHSEAWVLLSTLLILRGLEKSVTLIMQINVHYSDNNDRFWFCLWKDGKT